MAKPNQLIHYSSYNPKTKNPKVQNLEGVDGRSSIDPAYRLTPMEKFPKFGKPLSVRGNNAGNVGGLLQVKKGINQQNAQGIKNRQFLDTAQALRDSGKINKKQFNAGVGKYIKSVNANKIQSI